MQENPLFFCTYRISLYYFKTLHKYFLHFILLSPLTYHPRHFIERETLGATSAIVHSLEGELWAWLPNNE